MTGEEAYDLGNYATTLKEWRVLAVQGDASAQQSVGSMYYYGDGMPKNYAEAAQWYLLAAGGGNASAQFWLGWMHAWGRGVPQDNVQAHLWHTLAAAQGHEQARKAVDLLAEIMTPAQLADAQRLAREWKPKGK